MIEEATSEWWALQEFPPIALVSKGKEIQQTERFVAHSRVLIEFHGMFLIASPQATASV